MGIRILLRVPIFASVVLSFVTAARIYRFR